MSVDILKVDTLSNIYIPSGMMRTITCRREAAVKIPWGNFDKIFHELHKNKTCLGAQHTLTGFVYLLNSFRSFSKLRLECC